MSRERFSLDELPDFIGSEDLVNLGLFRSLASVHLAKSKGETPEHFKIGRKLVFPKESVKSFVKKRLEEARHVSSIS
jgi:hypothetical protein